MLFGSTYFFSKSLAEELSDECSSMVVQLLWIWRMQTAWLQALRNRSPSFVTSASSSNLVKLVCSSHATKKHLIRQTETAHSPAAYIIIITSGTGNHEIRAQKKGREHLSQLITFLPTLFHNPDTHVLENSLKL